MMSTPNHLQFHVTEFHVAEFRFTECHFTEFRCNDSVFRVFDRIA